jgi:FAD/FMN-containing dehydrogenase/Fe-S oxidoreductase
VAQQSGSPASDDPVDVKRLQSDLRAAVRGEVDFDDLSRVLYSTDASIYQIVPLGVVSPLDGQDVAATVRVCGAHGVSVTARGGGTSLAGQAVGAGVQLDVSRHMNRILRIDAATRRVCCQPGVVLDALNAACAVHGLQFGPDIAPSDRATLGGMVANNASGARSIVYGLTCDSVLGMDVVLADGSAAHFEALDAAEFDRRGQCTTLEAAAYRETRRLAREHADEIAARFPKLLRRVSGYNLDRFTDAKPADGLNLANLICGSEGTLAIVTELQLALVPVPARRVLLIAHFADEAAALEAVPAVLAHGPSAVELVDPRIIDAARRHPQMAALARRHFGDEGRPVLLCELQGDDPAAVADGLTALEADLRERHAGTAFARRTEPARTAEVWHVRKKGLSLLGLVKGPAKPVGFIEDAAVPPERLGEYARRLREIAGKYGVELGAYAHASAGLLHFRPLLDLRTASDIEKMRRLAADALELTLSLGGCFSGEHGDGLTRGWTVRHTFGPELYEAFGQLKRAFDPHGILNPGKIVDAPHMTENLRYGPDYRTAEVETVYDFSEYGGLTGAVEMCAGVADCRKRGRGLMCPSFMATGREADSTRGRANALRAALAKIVLGNQDGWTDPAVLEALDLCLACKGCKAECPSGVDMARLKSEFLHHYYQAHGVPRLAKRISTIDRLSALGSAWAPLSRWIARSLLGRWFARLWYGLDHRVKMPPFVRRTFRKRMRAHRPADNARTRGEVALFVDCFTNHYAPQVGMAAVDLLEHAGFQVMPANTVCCGRAAASKGMLERARELAAANVEALTPYANIEVPILGIEPSCTSMIRDEYPALVRTEDAVRVAAGTRSVEQFLLDQIRNNHVKLDLRRRDGRVLVHTHCHQKADGDEAAVELLGRIPGCRVELIDAGCCGMAGSFGMEAGHYEIAKRIGEDRLFPAVRAAGADVRIAVSGFSCRQQILHHCRRRTRHPLEILAAALP